MIMVRNDCIYHNDSFDRTRKRKKNLEIAFYPFRTTFHSKICFSDKDKKEQGNYTSLTTTDQRVLHL